MWCAVMWPKRNASSTTKKQSGAKTERDVTRSGKNIFLHLIRGVYLFSHIFVVPPHSFLYHVTPHYLLFMLDTCLLYTSDAADEEDSVDLGGRRIIKKKKKM
eukprot:TRINITY_DN4043_c0_g1_i10.p1 TRINITY_DN4043_c0_g1~~TRINITY_DN4043_c0_g1_i10.p1  ORF type:complete len:102 (-),score=9.92 TRINITY_DN4043_c0_g1_i10:101-406(-)